MPREASIWQRGQDGWFYCTHQGEQVKLSKDRAEAQKAFHTRKAHNAEPAAGYRPTFKKLADQYLAFTQQTKSDRTFKHQLYFLQGFCTHLGSKRAADLKPGDLTAWILKQKTWRHNTQVTARGIVVACLNWAVGEGFLPFSPFQKLKVGQMHRGGRVLTKEERERILGAVTNRTFRLFLRFLGLTGCRPYSEASAITAEMIDWTEGSITFLVHKNARKGKSRVVYLCDEAKDILRELSAERPEGPLFVTRNGRAYDKSNVIKAVRRLEEKLDMPRWNFTSLRKSYITDALEKGVSSDIVATLCGNSVKTIEKHYSFLESRKDALREAARRIVSG